MVKTRKEGLFYGWINAGLLFFIYMCGFGIVFYSYSVIFPYMIKSLQWPRGQASIARTIAVLAMGLLAPLTAFSIEKFGTKKTVLSGLTAMLVSFLLLGTIVTKFWMWNIIYGIMVGFGLALAGPLPIRTSVMNWFNIRRATVMGIVMTGGAVGGFVAQPFITWLMERSGSWRTGWLANGVIVLVALVLCLFTHNKPSEVGQYPDGLSPESTSTTAEGGLKTARTYRTPESWPLKEALKSPILWLSVVIGIASVQSLVLLTSHGVLHLTDLGYTRMQAAFFLSLLVLGSGISRFPMGWLADHIEPRWIMSFCMAIMLIAFVGIWKGSNSVILVVSCIAYGTCFGATYVLTPTMRGNYFGVATYPRLAGVIGPISLPFSALVPAGAGYIAERTGNYNIAFTIIAIVITIGAVSAFLLKPPRLKFKNASVD